MGGRMSKRVVVYIVEVDNGTGGWFPLTGAHYYGERHAKQEARDHNREQPKGSRIVFRVARYVRAEK